MLPGLPSQCLFEGERGEFGTGARGANPVGNCKVGMLASVLTAEQAWLRKSLGRLARSGRQRQGTALKALG